MEYVIFYLKMLNVIYEVAGIIEISMGNIIYILYRL